MFSPIRYPSKCQYRPDNPMTDASRPSVYKTMVEPHPDSIPNLTGWERPKHAYVLLEIPQINLVANGGRVSGKGLATVNAESRAEVMHIVDQIISEGGRVLDYGNFPKLNDPNPKRAEKALHYSKGSGQNAWDALERYVKMRMAGDVNWKDERQKLEDELNVLRAKLMEQEKREADKKTSKVEK
jgi:hypothetical protein